MNHSHNLNDCTMAFSADRSLVINMIDTYDDGWSGAAIVVCTVSDGNFTDVATATIENGSQGTFTYTLTDGVSYAF